MKQKEKSILYKLGMNRHHWIPRSRNGKNTTDNFSWIYEEKHRCWHYLFLHLTLDEVIRFLLKNGVYVKNTNPKAWRTIFKDKSVGEAVNLLERLKQIKMRSSRSP